MHWAFYLHIPNAGPRFPRDRHRRYIFLVQPVSFFVRNPELKNILTKLHLDVSFWNKWESRRKMKLTRCCVDVKRGEYSCTKNRSPITTERANGGGNGCRGWRLAVRYGSKRKTFFYLYYTLPCWWFIGTLSVDSKQTYMIRNVN